MMEYASEYAVASLSQPQIKTVWSHETKDIVNSMARPRARLIVILINGMEYSRLQLDSLHASYMFNSVISLANYCMLADIGNYACIGFLLNVVFP